MIYAQGNSGVGFTVANGIDWSLGTASTSWLNLGGVHIVDGSGNETSNTHIMPKITATAAAPGAGKLQFEVVAGTTGGTCKIIAYAGTSTIPVTIVDNVGAGC